MIVVAHKRHRLGWLKTLKFFGSRKPLMGGRVTVGAKAICVALLLLISSSFIPICAAQEPGYFESLGKTFTRGVKNIVSFPWEIPSTIGRYDQKTDGNYPFFRHTAGFVDGTFRAVTRLGCGVWDVLFSPVPGEQSGLPLSPETFF